MNIWYKRYECFKLAKVKEKVYFLVWEKRERVGFASEVLWWASRWNTRY